MQNLHLKLTSKYPKYNNWHQSKHHNKIHWGVFVVFTLLIFGTISRWTPISLAADTTAPTIPANLTAAVVSSSQINLSWSASTDNVGVVGYKIYRNSQFVNSLNSLMYSDTGLTASTAYTYTVSAYDAAGNMSIQSSSTTVTTLTVQGTNWTGTWTKLTPTGVGIAGDYGNCGGVPCGRNWVPGTYDSKRNFLVIFGGGIAGGCDSGYVNDLWTYSYTQNTWTQILPVKRSWEGADNINWPQGRDNHMLTYDDFQDLYWMYGGTCSEQGIWSFNPNTKSWIQYPVPDGVHPKTMWARYNTGFAYDNMNRKIVFFGGYLNGQPTNDTWIFDVVSKQWTMGNAIGALGVPPLRFAIENVLTYDSFHKKIVLFGGDNGRGVMLNDTWVYDVPTNIWTKMTSPVSPPGRMYHSLVYDSKNKVVALFGGSYFDSQGNGAALNDTWVYDLETNTWTQVQTQSSPPPMGFHVMAYDKVNDVVEMWRNLGEGGGTWVLKLISVGSDTIIPSVPINLTATAISFLQINLSWTASTDNIVVTGYKIYRCAGSGCTPTVQIATSATNSYSNTGLTASTAYTYAVSAYDAAGNESGKSTSVSAMTQSGAQTTLEIPLTIEEPAGIARTNEPITSGVPLPQGAQTTSWSLWDGNTEIPLQTTKLKGKTPWILLDFQTSVLANSKKTLTLKDTASTAFSSKPINITEDASQITVDNKIIKAKLSKTNFNLFEGVWLDKNNNQSFDQGEQIITPQPDNIQIIDSTTKQTFSGQGTPTKITWEYQGPLRSTLRVDGRYTNGATEFIAYTTRLTFYAGRSDVKIEHVLRNSYQPNERHVKVKSATLKVGAGGTTLSALCSGMENRVTCAGPIIAWANVDSSGMIFDLIPISKLSNEGLLVPDLSYHGSSIILDFTEGLSLEEQTQRKNVANSKLFAVAPSSWYAEQGNLNTTRYGTLDDEKTTYQNWGWTWTSEQEPRDLHKPNYWVSWKDVAVHDDSEADDLWQNLLMYLRTNQRGYWDRAIAWNRYYKWEYAFRTDGFDFGETRLELTIPLTSTDQTYLQNDVDLGRIDVVGWGADHLYGWGLLDYYYLMGDVGSLEAAEDIAEVSERKFGGYVPGSAPMAYYGPRQGARHLLFITRLFEVTQSTRWQDLMNHLAQLWLQSPDWDTRGFYPYGQYDTDIKVAPGSYAAGARAISTFQHGLLSHAFERYYALTGNTQIRDRLIAMAQWVKQYALQGTPDQTRATLALDWPNSGDVWQSTTIGGGAYTISLIDALVRGYRLTGDTSLLDRAKVHWDRGSRGMTGGSQVGRFVNDRFLSDNLYYSVNRGDLTYAHLLFYDYANIGSVPPTPSPDTSPPSTPTKVTTIAISSSQINLSWTTSTDDVGVVGYKIYRCAGSACVPTVQIATSATNSYSNTGLTASTAYTYAVSAYDAAGNESGKSTTASATTLSQFKQADFNKDGVVNQLDFDILKQEWNRTDRPVSDLNQDGVVDSRDLGIMMSEWTR